MTPKIKTIKPSKYILLRVNLFFKMLLSGKITFKKVGHLIFNYINYLLRIVTAGHYPSIICFDTTNQCNLFCGNCRTTKTDILDLLNSDNPAIPLGNMDYGLYERILEESHEYLLASVMYVSGEPFLNNNIYRMIKKASDLKVMTILSSNGVPLTEKNSQKIIAAGLDYIKIAISGFTQKTYEVYHRGGDIDLILKNIRALVQIVDEKKSNLVITLDYILFMHNEHEVIEAQKFAEELGMLFNIRVGATNGQKELTPKIPAKPSTKLCDWLWAIMPIGWNGKVYPCCSYTYTHDTVVLGEITDNSSVKNIWNGKAYQEFRATHIKEGRGAFPLCKNCGAEGVKFQS